VRGLDLWLSPILPGTISVAVDFDFAPAWPFGVSSPSPVASTSRGPDDSSSRTDFKAERSAVNRSFCLLFCRRRAEFERLEDDSSPVISIKRSGKKIVVVVHLGVLSVLP